MFEFIKSVFLYSGIAGLILVFVFTGLVISGWGIKLFSALIVGILSMICKLTGGKL